YYTDTIAQWRFFDQLLERVATLPGVEAAAMSTGLPATRAPFSRTRFGIEGKSYRDDDARPSSRLVAVSPSFFAALEIPVIAGRPFTPADREGTESVAIVTRAFARRYLQGDGVGKRIDLHREGRAPTLTTVVGVVGDVFDGDQRDATPPVIFQPLAQARAAFVSIAVRSAHEALAIAPSVRDLVRSLNPDLPLFWPQSLDDAVGQALWFVRVFGTLFLVFGAAALFLASVGLYAVMSFSVSRRTR